MPARESTARDLIYQTHFLDNNPLYEKLVFATTWYFNDVLDADKLHNSLTKLLSTGDWKKLAGRFRRGRHRKLELHVPAVFTKERPAVKFSQEIRNIKIEEHALYEMIPHPTSGISFHPSPLELRPHVVNADSPKTLEDLLIGDCPALSLHIISFENATIVTLTWCHCLMDAGGVGALVRAWSCILAGQEAPPLGGVRNDILYELAGYPEAAKEVSTLADARLKGIRMVLFVVFFIWELIFGRKEEARILFLPKGVNQRLHKKVLEDVAATSSDETREKRFVSEYGSIFALWAKSFAVTQPKPRPISILLPFDSRPRLQSELEHDKPYVQNMVLNSAFVLSPDLATGSLSSIATKLRETLQEHTQRSQILAFLRSLRSIWDAKGAPWGVYGHPWGRLLITTDWSKAKLLYAPDFAPAVLAGRESDNGAPLGSPFWYQTVPQKVEPAASRNSFVNLGRDHEGNSWQMGMLPSETWDDLLGALRKFEE